MTSHSRMSHHPGYLGLLVQFFCVFLSPLLNLFCFCYVFAISVLYCAHLCLKCSLGISNFLREISSLFILLFSSNFFFFFFLHCSLKKAFLSLLAIPENSKELCIQLGIFPFLLCLSLLFFSPLFARPPETTILPSCFSFSLRWFWLLPHVQCYKPPSIVLQALSIRSNPLNISVTSTV